jgi:hypothetical protein
MLTGTWSPRGAHGYVIGVAIGVRCELKVKLGMQKRLQGLDKSSERLAPLPFSGA